MRRHLSRHSFLPAIYSRVYTQMHDFTGYLRPYIHPCIHTLANPYNVMQCASMRVYIYTLHAFMRVFILLHSVCRYASGRWHAKPLSEAKSKRGLVDSFCDFDSTDDIVDGSDAAAAVPRIPGEYILRVVGAGGCIVREHCELENSRIVFGVPP